VLGLDCAQRVRVLPQCFQDGGSDLPRLDLIVEGGGLVLRIRYNQQNVAIVVSKAAMLGNLASPPV
jgi:hypothetical protein